MYVSVIPSRGNKYVYIKENVLDPDTGKRKQKIVKSLGRLELLEKKNPNFLSELRARYKQIFIDKKEQEADAVMDELSKHGLFTGICNTKMTNDPASATDPEQSGADAQTDQDGMEEGRGVFLSYGHCALRPIWRDWLHLDSTLTRLRKTYTDIEIPVHKIAFYLTALKVIDPCSHLGAYESQTTFLKNPVDGINLRNFYRTLEFLAEQKDRIMKLVGKSVSDITGRKCSLVFYDCTNCYFETDMDDRQRAFNKFVRVTRDALRKEGLACDKIDEYLDSCEFQELACSELSLAEDDFFRMRGNSKEHRTDLPLVTIALAIDEDGVPIDFEMFPGNISEYKTLVETIDKMRQRHPIENTVVVADRGLNSTSNLDELFNNGCGFVVAQKVSNLKSNLTNEMLDPCGYHILGTNEPIQSFEEVPFGSVAFKQSSMTRSGLKTVEDEHGGTLRVPVSIDVNTVFIFNPVSKKRELAQLRIDQARAADAVQKHTDMRPFGGSGWKSLVKVEKEARDEKEHGKRKKNIFKAVDIKKDVIDERRRLAGFSAIVYKAPPQGEDALDGAVVIGTYKKLVKIEECFRIMKSNFSLRPMYVRLEETITGHVTICVLALIMYRLLELKLQERGIKMSPRQICRALKEARLLAVPTGVNQGWFITGREFEKICRHSDLMEACPTDEDKTSRALKEMDSHSELTEILQTVGLRPLRLMNTIGDLNERLKIHSTYAQALTPAVCAAFNQKKMAAQAAPFRNTDL